MNLTITRISAAFAGLFLCVTISNAQSTGWTPPGPAVGSEFSEPLALQDQTGKPQTLKALLGPKGAAVFFVRSADWCPFCKRQLADANSHLAEFKALGLNVISVSHDEVSKIAEFHQAQTIGFTMLADPDGAIVEKLGIRNTEYADGSKAYGVARPMIFIINPKLKITHKYAEESYRDRPDLNKVLAELHGK
jgi:peroxiredoxin